MSSNKGKTWKNISDNLPENTILWRESFKIMLERIYFFLELNSGVYFKTDNTKGWVKLSSGMPNISVKRLGNTKKRK